MSEKKNINKASSLNFNLRSGSTNGRKMLYAVLKVNDKQIRISLGCKVYAQFWNKNRQECVICDGQSKEETENMTKTNQLIYAIRLCYCQGREYSYQKLSDSIRNIISSSSLQDSKQRSRLGISATALLNKAFTMQYGENRQKEQKENSTWKQYRRLLDEYFKFMKAGNIQDTIKDFLSQVAINNYKQHLVADGLAASSINHKVGIVVRLINKKLAIENDFLKYQIPPVKFEQVKDVRLRSENIRTALTDEEIEAIQNARGLSDTQREYRDIFLMQCFTSMRASDVRKIFTKDYTEEFNEGSRIIIIRAKKSRKENGYYSILVDSRIQEILDRYKDGFKAIDIYVNNDVFQQNLNDSIRKTAAKAYLYRIHTFCKSVGNSKEEHRDKLCNIITSHFARHTFISKKIREGYSTDEIKNMTAHTDDAMIDKVYRHLTDTDRANARVMAEKRHHKKTPPIH